MSRPTIQELLIAVDWLDSYDAPPGTPALDAVSSMVRAQATSRMQRYLAGVYGKPLGKVREAITRQAKTIGLDPGQMTRRLYDGKVG